MFAINYSINKKWQTSPNLPAGCAVEDVVARCTVRVSGGHYNIDSDCDFSNGFITFIFNYFHLSIMGKVKIQISVLVIYIFCNILLKCHAET